jgi:hypothetical protein
MFTKAIPRFARTDLATINTCAPDASQIESSLLQGDSYLLPSLMSISIIFYPFLNPINSPGTNPTAAAIGSPDAATVDGCAANCVAVLLSADP